MTLYHDAIEAGSERQKEKAKRFFLLGCIVKKDDYHYICLPIEGYNSTTYNLRKRGSAWTCDCQFFKTTHRNCSHMLALYKRLILMGHST